MRSLTLILMAAVVVSSWTGATAWADDTGFINIHTLRREGRVYCAVGHFHTGSGKVQKSKKRAIRSAARDWSSFTAWEYGTDWAKWRNARSKEINCSGPRGEVSCTVSARPCKPYRRRRG
ncbi:MAG: hypothetical protein ACR2PG_10115 [Hyphomicrobiaceae bacterium]